MKQKNLKYLIFDLDRTLFDTGTLINRMEKPAKETVGAFTLEIAERVNWNKIKPRDLVYPEVFKVLSSFQKKGYILYLWSDGDIEGQIFKLKFTGLDKFFSKDKRFIFEKDKEKKIPQILKKIPQKAEIWLFDDKPTKLRDSKILAPRIKTVLSCRGPWWQTEVVNFEPDYKIKDLKDLKEIL